MCLGAIYWARPKIIYYANTHKEAAAIGFDDSMIYEEINKDLKDRKIPTIHLESAEAKKIFLDWDDKKGKINY
jgi:tRNA(Arg) A34 adenosine deaminase TadA